MKQLEEYGWKNKEEKRQKMERRVERNRSNGDKRRTKARVEYN